jgi:DNA-binding CsgD family transcriptional regulator
LDPKGNSKCPFSKVIARRTVNCLQRYFGSLEFLDHPEVIAREGGHLLSQVRGMGSKTLDELSVHLEGYGYIPNRYDWKEQVAVNSSHTAHRQLKIQESLPEPGALHSGAVFSASERRVVALLHLDLSNKEIATHLSVSVHAVKFHLSNIFRKTGTINRSELYRYLTENR